MSPVARAIFDELVAALRTDPRLRDELRRALAAADGDDQLPEHVTVAAAAALAQVTPATVRRWARGGDVRTVGAGRRLRVCRADVERVMREPSKKRSQPARDGGRFATSGNGTSQHQSPRLLAALHEERRK